MDYALLLTVFFPGKSIKSPICTKLADLPTCSHFCLDTKTLKGCYCHGVQFILKVSSLFIWGPHIDNCHEIYFPPSWLCMGWSPKVKRNKVQWLKVFLSFSIKWTMCLMTHNAILTFSTKIVAGDFKTVNHIITGHFSDCWWTAMHKALMPLF